MLVLNLSIYNYVSLEPAHGYFLQKLGLRKDFASIFLISKRETRREKNCVIFSAKTGSLVSIVFCIRLLSIHIESISWMDSIHDGCKPFFPCRPELIGLEKRNGTRTKEINLILCKKDPNVMQNDSTARGCQTK